MFDGVVLSRSYRKDPHAPAILCAVRYDEGSHLPFNDLCTRSYCITGLRHRRYAVQRYVIPAQSCYIKA